MDTGTPKPPSAAPDDATLNYQLTNSQRMALCTFLGEYVRQEDVPLESVDCIAERVTTATDLLAMFLNAPGTPRVQDYAPTAAFYASTVPATLPAHCGSTLVVKPEAFLQGKVLLSSERDVQRTTICGRLKQLVSQMESGDYTESDAAVLITRDKATGNLTFIHMTERGLDDSKALFNAAAKTLGYARVA